MTAVLQDNESALPQGSNTVQDSPADAISPASGPTVLGVLATNTGLAGVSGVSGLASVYGATGLMVAGGAVGAAVAAGAAGAGLYAAYRKKRPTNMARTASRVLPKSKRGAKAGKAALGAFKGSKPGRTLGAATGRAGALGRMFKPVKKNGGRANGSGSKPSNNRQTAARSGRAGGLFSKASGARRGAAKKAIKSTKAGAGQRGGNGSLSSAARPHRRPGNAKRSMFGSLASRKRRQSLGAAKSVSSRASGRRSATRRDTAGRLARAANGVPQKPNVRVGKARQAYQKTCRGLARTRDGWRSVAARAEPAMQRLWGWAEANLSDEDGGAETLPPRQSLTTPLNSSSTPVPAGAKAVPMPSLCNPKRKETNMSSDFSNAIEAVSTDLGSWAPGNARSVVGFYDQLEKLFDSLSNGLGSSSQSLVEGFPIDPAAAEHVQSLAERMRAFSDHLEEARAAFESAHAEDLERINNPRVMEEKWDYSTNQE